MINFARNYLKDMKKHILIGCLSLFSFISVGQEQVYELRTYELNFFKSADLLHRYLSEAFIPAMNRLGSKSIGVFEEEGATLPAKIYVLIPYATISDFQSARKVLEEDEQYQKAAANYFQAGADEVPFDKIQTSLIQSSVGFPELKNPRIENGFFELRIYTSPNEAALRSKLKMFDEHEFPIFEDAGLNMVFFGVNLAGGAIPCLTYLLATESKEANATGWSQFIQHPEWKRISALEEFKGNMNNILRVYLKPLAYSQL